MATKIGAPKNEFPIKPVESMLPVIASNTVFVVADTETTGFGAYDDILEIGAVKIDVETHKVIQSFSTYCRMKNHQKVPQKIVDLTGIQTEDVAEAPKIETVLPAFRQFVDGCPIVFHNAAFDWRMLGNKYKLLGARLNNEVICTMKLFKHLHPEAEASNLDFITKFYGTPIVGHHRAVVDCKWTAAAFCKMREEVLSTGVEPVMNLDILVGQQSMPAMTMAELNTQCRILRVNGWKKGKVQRIYCTTNLADVCYDLGEHVWNVVRKRTDRDLDINVVSKFILSYLGCSLIEFQEKYAPSA